jgi:hypothetical protein
MEEGAGVAAEVLGLEQYLVVGLILLVGLVRLAVRERAGDRARQRQHHLVDVGRMGRVTAAAAGVVARSLVM